MESIQSLNDLEWQENSRAMYEVILQSVPSLFKSIVRENILVWVCRNQIKVVTEEVLFRAVDDIAPPDLANKHIKPGLEALRTKRN